jgi:hypothetical protein
MQQRQPRLGDIVDDYCPRERRITNHAVVAMIGDEVKQTRCSTCDAEHQYKQAKIPPQRRKKEVEGVLYQQVLEGMPRKVGPGLPAAPPTEMTDAASLASPDPVETPEPLPEMAEPTAADGEPEDQQPVEEGPVHRRLIRATLPRLTDEPPQRREPDFTIRNTQNARHGRFGKTGFRGHRPGAAGPMQSGANGNNRPPGPKRHGHGHGGGRPAGGGGRPGPSPQGNRGPRPGGHGHGRGGKKSSR